MSDLDGQGLRPPRLGTYQQIVSLKRKPVQARAGPYHQGAPAVVWIGVIRDANDEALTGL